MVYVKAARKTGGLMAVAGLVAVGIVTFLTEDLSSPTGHVIATDIVGNGWLVFVLGLFIGAMMVGSYFYIASTDKDE